MIILVWYVNLNIMEKVNAIIIDDERANISLLAHFLEKYCIMVNVIGEATTMDEAVALIDKTKPDLVFLDIMLEDHTGFEVLDKTTFKDLKIIFVTAHNEYAIKAFKYSTIGYILKPIEIEELVLAVNVAVKDINNAVYTEKEHLKHLNGAMNQDIPLGFIAVPSIDKIEFILVDDIVYLKSEGRYTFFYLTDGSKVVASRNLGDFEDVIDKLQFFRIHNSYIVNLKHVVSINKADGSYCEMITKVSLPIAKRRQDELNRFLKIK